MKDHPFVVTFVAMAAVIAIVLAIESGNGSQQPTYTAPQITIPTETQQTPDPAQARAEQQNEQEQRAGDAQVRAVEKEIDEEEANAKRYAQELYNSQR